ncbi:MAG: hypothetical protein SFU98_10465 [Leptospiraceae bacterium]|nr:hypothetical protein [Leptospiraceae bacterium]
MIPKIEQKFKQLNSIHQAEVLDFMEFLLSKDLKTSSKSKKEVVKPKLLNASKYCGILKLSEDPILIQKRLRDEWK